MSFFSLYKKHDVNTKTARNIDQKTGSTLTETGERKNKDLLINIPTKEGR